MNAAPVPSPSLTAAMERWVWYPEQWVRHLPLSQQAPPLAQMDAAVLHQVVARLSPAQALPWDDWLQSQGFSVLRLALLGRDEWLRLGLVLAMLPMSGRARRSIDGHFRRTVQHLLGETGLDDLDTHPPSESWPCTRLGAGAWRDPSSVALGGLNAALSQVCHWPATVKQRFVWGFTPAELAQTPALDGLTPNWMEFACKISCPKHPWLWS